MDLMMNKYQRRVQVSMEKLDVPSWYRSPGTSSPTPTRLAASRSASSPGGWRRHLSQPSPFPSRRLNLDRYQRLPSSQRQGRVPQCESLSPCVPYLGWRKEQGRERLYWGPAQRLARSCKQAGTGEQRKND